MGGGGSRSTFHTNPSLASSLINALHGGLSLIAGVPYREGEEAVQPITLYGGTVAMEV